MPPTLEDQNQNLEQNQEDQQPITQEAPPATPINQDPPLPSWQSVVFQANRRAEQAETDARQLREQAELERQQRANPPIRLEPGETFNDPERFRQVLRQDMAEMVRPLNDFVNSTSRMMQYQNLKNNIKAQSVDVSKAITQIEPRLDRMFQEDVSLQINENAFMRAVKEIVGDLMLSGQLAPPVNNSPNNPPNNPPNRPVLPPPNIRSNQPNNRTTPPNNPLNIDTNRFDENARRLARENGMTLVEYGMLEQTPDNKAEEVWRDILKARKENRRYGVGA